VVLHTLAPAERVAFVLHDICRRMEAVEAFLATSRDGDFERLVALLHPEAVLIVDAAAVQAAAANEGRDAPRLQREVRGARAVAETFKGRARATEPALVDGEPGAVWAPGGTPRAVFVFTIEDDRIAAFDLVVEPARLAAIDVGQISG
jgi:ketosteroid isomerase-like protein